jgi:subtilisin family serine protease
MTIRKMLSVVLGLAMSATAMQAGAQPIANQYIVVLEEPAPGSAQRAQPIADLANSLLALVGGGQVLTQYTSALLGFTARISASQAAALARQPGVKLVEQDRLMRANVTQAGATWGLDRVDQRALPLNGNYVYADQAGQGVHVYIIDTGLNAAHAEFSGRVGAGRNFASNTNGLLGGLLPINLPLLGGLFGGSIDPENTSDCNGHGTHVAGTAAGTVYGVAKQATVHAVRVLGCNGSGANSGVIAGVDWVAANRVLPAVANMSLGGAASEALDVAVNNAIAQGVSFVVAAGNDNANACNGSPNRVPDAITVGASTRTDSRDTGYSNFGPCVDLFAPGTGITSAWIGNASATSTISGTSMAAPHVAGAVALVLGANAGLTPAQVTDAVLGNVTLGALANVGNGSPNALLYTGN